LYDAPLSITLIGPYVDISVVVYLVLQTLGPFTSR